MTCHPERSRGTRELPNADIAGFFEFATFAQNDGYSTLNVNE